MSWVLDLFCGAGGVARGFERHGYDVVGIDIDASCEFWYPGKFLTFDLTTRDAMLELKDVIEKRGKPRWIWASPPCQKFSRAGGDGPNLIPRAKNIIEAIDPRWYAIENVPEARSELDRTIMLSGESPALDTFGKVRKRRVIETNVPTQSPPREQTDFEYQIHDTKGDPEGYRQAHGINDPIPVDRMRDVIPPTYVEYLLNMSEQVDKTINATKQ